MKDGFEPGLATRHEAVVTDEMLSWMDGKLLFPVISTVSVAALMEHAGRRLVEPYLDEGEEALGVEISIEHIATCGAGKRITVTAELVMYRHQRISLSQAVFDGDRLIATGVQTLRVLPREALEAAIAAGQA
jgi:predicted thioesterase